MKLANPLTAIFHPPPTPGVLAVFGHLDATVDAIDQLRRGGHTDFTVYSPIPRHEIEDALEQPVSPVRMFADRGNRGLRHRRLDHAVHVVRLAAREIGRASCRERV